MKQILTQALVLVPVILLHGVASMIALVVFLLMSLNSVSNTSMTQAAMKRLDALMPKIFPNTGGTVSGNVVVTGNHNINGFIAGSGGGTLEASSGIHSSGNVQADGQAIASSVNVGGSGSGATVAINGNLHASSAGQFDGGISASNYQPGQGAPSGYPIALGTPWENQIITFLNSMVSKLQSAGVY